MAISFDRVAERYDATRGLPDDVMAKILDTLERMLSKDAPILDAGVGTGRFALPLENRGYEVIGLDVATRMLQQARNKGLRSLLRGNLCVLPFNDLVFGATISVHVLHLITDWRCALAEIGRVTRGDLYSILSDKEASPAQEVRKVYEGACQELEYEVRHVGIRERELPDLLPPDGLTQVLVYEHDMEVRAMIDGFRDRIFSNLWSVPEEIHQKAIRVIEERFEDVETLMEIEKIGIVSWKAQKLRNFCSFS